MASATWLSPLKRVHWSYKLLVCALLVTIMGLTIFGVWLAALPKQPAQVNRLPQFAANEAKPARFPINLPEPAAGSAETQSKVTFELQVPEKPKTASQASKDPGTTAPLRPTAQTPRALNDTLTDSSSGKPLPVIAGDGTTPFEAYRTKPGLAENDDRARIAIIVTGIGLNTQRSQATFDQLPAAVTIAVSPYAKTPQKWIDLAFETGRDVLVMVPMEPNSFPTVDPGPDTLMRDAPTNQTIERLHAVLGAMQGYVGIINDTGSRFTANEIAVAPVLDDLAKRGLMVVDARASAYTVLAKQAQKRGIPVAMNTRFIDSSLSPTDIDRQLRDLERTAQAVGAAVGVMRNLPVTLDRVETWQKTLNNDEFVLAPISAVANRQPIR